MKESQTNLIIALIAGILSCVATSKLIAAMAAIVGTIYAAISIYEFLHEQR